MVPQIWRVTRGNQGSGGSLQFRQGSSAWILRVVLVVQVLVIRSQCRVSRAADKWENIGGWSQHFVSARQSHAYEGKLILTQTDELRCNQTCRQKLLIFENTDYHFDTSRRRHKCLSTKPCFKTHSHTSLTMLTCLTEEPMNYVVRITC